MKTHSRCLMAAIAGCTVFLASCASTTPAVPVTRLPVSVAAKGKDSSVAGMVHSRVNSYRQSTGRTAIPRDARLDALARQHSQALMAKQGKSAFHSKTVGHDGFGQRVRYAQQELGMEAVAENVACGPSRSSAGIDSIIAEWKKSSGHHFAMKQKWHATGVGVAVDRDGTVFVTQIFATKGNSALSPQQKFRHF